MLLSEFWERITVLPLEDVPSDKQWTLEILDKINLLVKNTDCEINIYCWDIINDYAIQVIKQYEGLFKNNKAFNCWEDA